VISRIYPLLRLLTSQPECDTCRLCEENVGLVYLLRDEISRAANAGAMVVASADEKGYIERTHHGWCGCFDAATGRCRIYDSRPLCCRIYPLDLIRFDDGIWWVIHEECPIGIRFYRERQTDLLAAVTFEIERQLTDKELLSWLSQDRFSQNVEALSRDSIKVRRLRQLGSEVSALFQL
jgi:Fe-S-cluster containining protein